MTNRFVLFILLLMPSYGFPQVFGGNPPNIKWQSISVSNATIVFPKGSIADARRIGGIIGHINERTDSSTGPLRKPVQVVLQPSTTYSNGYVALAPFRSEFFLTPPSNPFELGSLPWTDQLALHEYRHVQQYSNYNRGIAKIFKVVLGEQGQALANALTVPDWFFEGDAVFQETLLSNQGRGRTASFFNGYRAIWEAGLDYSNMTLRNGSLRYFIPNHYELGYQLVAFGRDKYGAGFWNKTSMDAAAMRGFFYPFQKAVRRYSGLNYADFFREAISYNKNNLLMAQPVAGLKPPRVQQTENPVFTEEGNLVYLKSSYSSVPVFTKIQNGIEKKIRVSDRTLDHYFGYSNNTIVYASFRPDLRWGWVDYSELQVLDLVTGKQQRISKNSRFFTPAISATGDSILALHIPISGRQELVLLKKEGARLKTIPNTNDYTFYHPVFWKGNILVAVRNKQALMTLMSVNPEDGVYTKLLPWSGNLIGYPHGSGDTVLFTKTIHGHDRLFAFDAGSGKTFLLENTTGSSETGQYQPAMHGGELAFMQFTAGGRQIKKTLLNNIHFYEVVNTPADTANNFGVKSIYSTGNAFLNEELVTDTVIATYPKTKNIFNFHSWQPYYEDPEFSFSLYGQNILNTFQSQLYGSYNRNEGFTRVGYTGLYGGFFPYMKGAVEYTFNRRGLIDGKTIYWNQLQSKLGFSIPLNLSRGRSISYFSGGTDLVFTKDYFRQAEVSKPAQSPYLHLDHDIRFSHQVQQARQEFNPRFAQTIHLNFRHTLNKYDSWQFLEAINLYFPGFFTNHSLVLNLAAQQRDSSRGIRFSNGFPFSRGFSAENFYKTMKWGINYQFPLVYPDIGAWNIVYLLRVRTNLFYDMASVKDPGLPDISKRKLFRSFGNELFFDTKWWNQLPVSFGVRYARLLDDDIFGGNGKNRWQIVLPVNLIPNTVNARKYPVF